MYLSTHNSDTFLNTLNNIGFANQIHHPKKKCYENDFKDFRTFNCSNFISSINFFWPAIATIQPVHF